MAVLNKSEPWWFFTCVIQNQIRKIIKNGKMNKLSYIAFLGLLVFSFAACAPRVNKAEVIERLEAGEVPEEVTRAAVDPAQSTVQWLGQKITGDGHYGTLNVKSGELIVFDGRIWGGNVVVDMTTIQVVDITDPGPAGNLKGHLESDDFFSVASFPEASLQLVKFEPIEGAAAGAPNYRVSGNLTIKGITQGIAFDALIDHAEGQIAAKADFYFDRSVYDVRFGSGRFFENLGDNLINDNVNLKVSLVAAY